MEVQKIDTVHSGIADKENKDLQRQIQALLDVIAQCIATAVLNNIQARKEFSNLSGSPGVCETMQSPTETGMLTFLDNGSAM